jgi:hypothetical protein
MSWFKELAARLSQWWNSTAKTAKEQGAGRAEDLRRGATAGAQRAASRVQDFRDSERGQRAASKLSDLRSSDTAKKAESALTDLRQREPVKKAEESARKVMNDLFSGGSSDSGTAGKDS